MTEFRYDTYCGLYCGACEILMAYKTGNEENIAPQIRSVMPPQAAIKCHGCKSDTVFVNCEKCPIRSCARTKDVGSCGECKDFPCRIYEGTEETKEIIKKLLHLRVIPKNLNTIKEKGVTYWLNEQEQKWKCPKCKTSFAWYAVTCSNCGEGLEQIKDYNNL